MTPFRRKLLAQKHGSSETDHVVFGPTDYNFGSSDSGKWINATSCLRGVSGEKVRIEFDYEYEITNPSATQTYSIRTHSKTGIADNSYYYLSESVTETASKSAHFSQTWTTINDSVSMRSYASRTLNEGTFKISNFTIYEVY
jgi:hypothetical protein